MNLQPASLLTWSSYSYLLLEFFHEHDVINICMIFGQWGMAIPEQTPKVEGWEDTLLDSALDVDKYM